MSRILSTGVLSLAAFIISLAAPAYGNIIITPVFDSTITNDANAAEIKQTIMAALDVYSANIATNITVVINFAEMGSGLGQSSTYIGNVSYTSVHTGLVNTATSLDDNTALANLPGGINNPVDGSQAMSVTTANLRALGINANPPAGQPDSFIGLNTSLMNLSRNAIDPNKYDLLAVVSHEVDEALGLGSGLNGTNVRPEDLFRYDSAGNRNYTTSSGAVAYFSLNGTTQLAQFNQINGGDFGDWASSGTPKVQDAFGTQGATPNLGVELRALDVIGYTLAAPSVPEPATWSMLGIGFAALLAAKRSRRRAES